MKLLWEKLRSSLWPIPLLMVLAAAGFVELTRSIDAHLAGPEALSFWVLRSGNGDDARNLLSTLATSIITIASLVFSITIVALSLAANQFGSRLVRTYVTDMRTKLSLGFFLFTIVYCLLGLRLVSQEMSRSDVPHVTVTASLVLGIACVLVLVMFLHVVAKSIVADEVIRRVARELDDSIDSLPPAGEKKPEDRHAELLPAGFEAESQLLTAWHEGYVQEIRHERLAAMAARDDIVLRIDVMAGDYVCKHGWIGRVFPAARCSRSVVEALAEAVVIGPRRTPVQDLAYSIRHLADVALRALSPGINDPNTALAVIDRLSGAMARLFARSLPDGVFFDEAGRCRLLCERRTHADLLAGALRPIRDAAARQPLVVVAMLEALSRLAEHAGDLTLVNAVQDEGGLIAQVALLQPMAQSEQTAIALALRQLESKISEVRRRSNPPPPA